MEYKVCVDSAKKKLILNAGLASLVLSIYSLILTSFYYSSSFLHGTLISLEVVTILVILFLLTKMSLKTPKKNPIYIFNENGIEFKGLIFKNFLSWNDISFTKYDSHKGLFFIVFKLKENNSYTKNLAMVPSLSAKYRLKKIGGEIALSFLSLGNDCDQIFEFIKTKTFSNNTLQNPCY
ncbi:MAG: hypothetical protein ACRCYE_10705 [Sarcina sp.]